MTIFGGQPATEGVGIGTIKDGFLVICTKCGWHSTVTYYDGRFICTREECKNEADVNDHNGIRIHRNHAGNQSPDFVPEDTG